MVNKNRNLKKQSHSRYSLKKGKRPAGLHSQYVVISADKNAEKKDPSYIVVGKNKSRCFK